MADYSRLYLIQDLESDWLKNITNCAPYKIVYNLDNSPNNIFNKMDNHKVYLQFLYMARVG